mgnify:CR=1 FL=1
MTTTTAPALKVRHIDHVTVVVKDLEASRRFYVDILGMDEVERPAFGFPGLWFQAGPTQIHLIEQNKESGPAGNQVAADASISRTRHFAFEVEDAGAAQAALESAGLTLAAGPKQRPDGPTQIYVQDPDGHLVELFSHGR